MITDPIPRSARGRAAYQRSDELRALLLPDVELPSLARAIEAGLADDDRAKVQAACGALAAEVARANDVAPPPVAVLGVRPHRTEGGRCVYEKFGDYDLETSHIRIWMRTALRRQVTAYGTLLSTLCHEICHHLDVARLGLADTPHTRGFFERAGLLYHHARGTPPRALVWARLPDGRYRIDWPRTMRSRV